MKPAEPPILTTVFLSMLLMLCGAAKLRGEDYRYSTNAGMVTITSYTGAGGVVAVPDTIQGLPVRCIGSEAFIYCSDLLEVTIPGSVTNIGDMAFLGCVGLTSVNLTGGIISIGEQAFRQCLSLGSINIPASVASIGDGAFNSCESLLGFSVDPQNASYSSRDGMLFDRSQATLITFPAGQGGNVNIPDGVITIGLEAFASCSRLERVVIPPSARSIEDGAFADCSLTDITIPFGVTNLGRFAFATCDNLAEVAIPGSVTSLQEGAFKDCPSLTRMTIPGSVSSIGYGAFANCTGLTNVDILTGVTSIAKQAFYECIALGRVLIPKSVTLIGTEAFFFCTNLTAVYFEGDAPTADFYAFDFDDHATFYYLPETAGWAATYGGRPTAVWWPRIQTADGRLGVQANQFGFNITWASGKVVVIEACTNLVQSGWLPIGTNTLAGGSSHFVDPEPANHAGRFYRIRWP